MDFLSAARRGTGPAAAAEVSREFVVSGTKAEGCTSTKTGESVATSGPPARDAPALAKATNSDSVQRTRAKWQAEQRAIASQVCLVDDASPQFRLPTHDASFVNAARAADPTWVPPVYTANVPLLTRVGGLDISFVANSNAAIASIAVFSYPEKKLLCSHMMHCEMNEPYIPTFLAFREVPPLSLLLDEFHKLRPELAPQLLMLDGNGVLHPRRCGVASHLGVLRGIPTIGVAKDFLAVPGLTREQVEANLFSSPQRKLCPLTSPDGTMWGHVALTGNSTRNPIYISPGHLMSYGSAVALTLSFCVARVPEPIRQADLLSRAYIRKMSNKGVVAVEEDSP